MLPTSRTMNDFYVILSSRHSKSYFKNTPSSFKVKLNTPLILGPGWKVALYQYKSTLPVGVYVCSDICTTTIVGESQYHILRHVSHITYDLKPMYVPVSQGYVDCIQIYLIDEKTEERMHTSSRGSTYVTLHFIYNQENKDTSVII